MITRATVRYLIVHPESSEESSKNRSSHAHTHPLFPYALAHTRSFARTYNINSCIYIFIYMLYIIYKTQYSSWFFLCTWGRGSMALHETLHIYMSFHLREIRQALSRPCTRTWIPGSRVSGFSCRQWSIVAPWLRRPACEKEKRSGFVFSLSFFFCFFLSFYITTRQWWAASWAARSLAIHVYSDRQPVWNQTKITTLLRCSTCRPFCERRLSSRAGRDAINITAWKQKRKLHWQVTIEMFGITCLIEKIMFCIFNCFKGLILRINYKEN